MKGSKGIGLALILTIFVGGCAKRLNHPIKCQSILALRIGQSRDEVHALLGEPTFAVEQRTLFPGSHTLSEDEMWSYGTSDIWPGSLPIGLREEMRVAFLQGSLVGVSGYRMYDRVITRRELPPGILIRNAGDYGRGPEPASYFISDGFPEIFDCGPDFSFEKVEAPFKAILKPKT